MSPKRNARLRWYWMKAQRRLTTTACRTLYRDVAGGLENAAILAGAARSGTTWLADLLQWHVGCRVLFEPFSPANVRQFSGFPDFQYLRSRDRAPALRDYVERVLLGRIRDPWIDREVSRLVFRRRLVKTIRAKLFLRWLHDQFPVVPLTCVVRHPCAVVLSRLEANWSAKHDLAAFRGQPALMEDYLNDYLDVLNALQTPEEQHAAVWCVQHLVLMNQFTSHELPVVFYERLCLQPEVELPLLFKSLGHEYEHLSPGRLARASRTASLSSAVITGEGRATRWQTRLSAGQIARILDTVRRFQLDHVYGDSPTPISADSFWPAANAASDTSSDTSSDASFRRELEA